ncbi:hypothetical protein Natpe_3927 (plasmid) [Natrinema pellirubrum DSM 15624]|uniref:Uncharacterized protein n=1 Tax=Natrinema pellirubrum (strain DSM 15624 / CIP 106293 / JCM 10476 / NCIMB 786 / 157) TaxID=797303 RepID=L0JQ76_NATP1|nr:hypothetical protein Natpe_3927 [Natrinema pellirubrum DSM 15624]
MYLSQATTYETVTKSDGAKHVQLFKISPFVKYKTG